MMYCIFYVQAS